MIPDTALLPMTLASGKSDVNAGTARAIGILTVALVALLAGCGDTVESLVERFPTYKSNLEQLKGLMVSLKHASKVTGYLTQHGDQKNFFVDTDGRTIDVDRIPTDNHINVQRIGELMREVNGRSVHLMDHDVLWVVMDSGGVLASDIGYTSYDVAPPFPSGDKAKYFPIRGERTWYVFIR